MHVTFEFDVAGGDLQVNSYHLNNLKNIVISDKIIKNMLSDVPRRSLSFHKS